MAGTLLYKPHTAATGGGNPYKVYTPYWKKVKDRMIEPIAESNIDSLKFTDPYPETLALKSLGLLPEKQWHHEFFQHWEVSEAAAQERLEKFLNQPVEGYNQARDIPSEEGTSSL